MSRVGRLPVVLKLAPKLAWKGKLRLESKFPDGQYQVQFDAEVARPKPGAIQNIIYDRAVFSRSQVIAWTGVDPETMEKFRP